MGMLSMARRNPKDLLGYLIAVGIGMFASRLAPSPTSAAYIYILVSFHVFLAWVVLLNEENSGLSMPIGTTILTHTACVFLAVGATMARHYIPFFGLLRFGIIAIAGFERKWLFTVSRNAPRQEEAIDLLKPLQGPPLKRVSSTMSLPQAQAPVYAPPAQPASAGAQLAGSGALTARTVTDGGIPKYQPLAAVEQPAAAEPQAKQAAAVAAGPGKAKRQPAKEAGAPILSATAQDHEDWLRERARMNPTHRRPGVTVREEYEDWLRERFRHRAAKAAAR